jgi:hypothetical protein
MALPRYSAPTWAPADEALTVTPSDVAELNPRSRALYVGVAGDLTVDMATGGTDILFKAVPAGTLLPLQVKKVKLTGTTASQIVAIY